MASIQKKGKKFYVTYREKDPLTKQMKPIWEPFNTLKEAQSRKIEIEYEKDRGTFVAPNDQTIAEYLDTFVEIYGTQNWGPHTYETNVGMINHYINPLIGKVKMKNFKTMDADKFIKDLRSVVAVKSKKKANKVYLSDGRIERIGKLLKTAFKQAEIWELVTKDPFKNIKLPKADYEERAIWNAKQIQTALELCDDALLYITINLAFAGTLRIGEALGLTWDTVAIDDEHIKNDDAYIYVEKQLQRINKESVELLRKCHVFARFPSFVKRETKSQLMLVGPKTKTSTRKIWIPRTVAYMLREWKKIQDEDKKFLGDQYEDYNLVFANEVGRPITENVVNKRLKNFQKENNLPVVDLHSLRHSSTTYKLKLNKGDLKATQGDTGHATTDMIMKVYAHILDEDRKVNATKLEDTFYNDLNDKNKEALGKEVKSSEEKQKESAKEFLNMLKDSPELREQFSKLINID
jgi:integrase